MIGNLRSLGVDMACARCTSSSKPRQVLYGGPTGFWGDRHVTPGTGGPGEGWTMSIDAMPIMVGWVAVGERACGLVFAGRIAALVYWQPAQLTEAGAEPMVCNAGFSWVPVDLPVDHFFLVEAPDPDEADWARARELAASAYLDWMRREAGYTAELRREAAELLSRSRWWQDEQLREELLSRAWYRPPGGERR